MESDHLGIIAVKAVLDCECKRFGIPVTSTYPNLVSTLSGIFACDISDIQYRDGDDDLVSMGSEEEFSLALKSVPKTGGILRLVLLATGNATLNTQCSTELQCDKMELNNTNNSISENDISIEEANRRSHEMLTSMENKIRSPTVVEPEEKKCTEDKDTKVASGETRKPSIRHKIESASQLSKDLNFNSCEVTGHIPVLAQSSVCSLDTHFTSQKPGVRKVRRVSSGTTSGGTDKNDKKQSRGRQTQRKKKRKHRDSSSSSSDTSTSRSSTSSSSSSSESSCEENYHYYKKSSKKKRKESPNVNIEKIIHKCEKQVTAKVCKDMDEYTKKFKEDVISAVTGSILQKLDGAILQSFVVPNGGATQSNEVNPAASTSKPVEGVTTKRMRYQHQNVVCDHCENEIFGPRYKCGNCSDYDLCEKCETIEGLHTPSHVFVKMHFPAVHAGRRSIGGKSRPLLRANIYEEREKEREMEDLLQRKLDSGSELNQKVMEKFDKRRTKMKEGEHAKDAYHNRKEEWKKMKKEIKKNKKELKKKLKQQGKLMQRNSNRGATNNKEEIFLSKEGFCFDVENIAKVDQKVVKEPDFMEGTMVKVEIQDEKLSSALSSLQIVQAEPVVADEENISDNNASTCNEDIIDLTTDSDDVVVVDREAVQININAANSGVEILKKPDLVDFNRDVAESTSSEDFIVVSNYFDLSVPIDDEHLLEHRNCESCHNCHNNFTPDFILPHSACTATANELPMDLVASVPVTARNQPDIASLNNVNIMDQSIENFSSVSSSPPISPEPINVTLSDEVLTDINLIHPADEVIQLPDEANKPITSQPAPISNEIVSEPILIQPEVVACNSLNDLCPVVEDIHAKESVYQQHVHVAEVPSPVFNTDVDVSNPIIQAQIEREEMLRNNCLMAASLNTFESARTGVHDVQEETHEVPHGSSSAVSGTVSNSSGGGLSGALVGAMATIVDTVAHVVQSAKGSPKAEYHNGEVEVMIPVHPGVEGMQQLLDMGFFDRPLNERLLLAHNNDVGRCVADLIAENNNQWYQTRH